MKQIKILAIALIVSSSAFAQDLNKELGKPQVAVIDNLKLDVDVNTIVEGTTRLGDAYILVTYFDNGNTVRHTFRNDKCIEVMFKSTNFRNYDLFNKVVDDTMTSALYKKFRETKQYYAVDVKVTKVLWSVRIFKK